MEAQETAYLSCTSSQTQTVAKAGPQKETTSAVSALVESKEDVQRVAVVSCSSGTPREEVSSGSGREDVESGAIPSPQDVLSLISSKYLRKLDPSTPEEFNGFLDYMERMRKAVIVDVATGSLIVTIECGSLGILEGLWKDYITGRLNEMAQRFLVTEEILEELGLAEVKLTTTIKEEEYRACHELLAKFAGIFLTFISLRNKSFGSHTIRKNKYHISTKVQYLKDGTEVVISHVMFDR